MQSHGCDIRTVYGEKHKNKFEGLISTTIPNSPCSQLTQTIVDQHGAWASPFVEKSPCLLFT